MSNPLAALGTDSSIKQDADTLGGVQTLDSNVYPMTISQAYIMYSKKKAMSLVLNAKSDKGEEFRATLWMTGNETKGCKNYYERNGEKHYLPGFNVANAIAELTVGKGIGTCDVEEKVVNIYDYEAKKELPTAVPMFVELTGQKIALGIIKEIVDKQKDDGTGTYVNTGETREQNEILNVFSADTGLTLNETKAKESEPVFLQKWKDKWVGQVRNKAKGLEGATGNPTANAGTAAPASKSLFG